MRSRSSVNFEFYVVKTIKDGNWGGRFNLVEKTHRMNNTDITEGRRQDEQINLLNLIVYVPSSKLLINRIWHIKLTINYNILSNLQQT